MEKIKPKRASAAFFIISDPPVIYGCKHAIAKMFCRPAHLPRKEVLSALKCNVLHRLRESLLKSLPTRGEESMRKSIALAAVLLSVAVVLSLSAKTAPRSSDTPSEIQGAYRLAPKNGWTFVHLQGTPHQIGFQNGYLLAPETADMLNVVKLEATHDSKKDWAFFRDAAQNMMWPHIEQEYREELQGISDGATAHGVKIDIWDVVALNAAMEWSYYVKQYDKDHGLKTASLGVPE